MREYPIIVTDRDLSRLRGLLGGMSQASILDRGHLGQLQSELDRALVVPCDEVPVGVVTIDSLVRVVDLDTGKRSVLTLVLPDEADIAERRISVLAPIGTALLGFRASDDVDWTMPGGRRRLHIEHVIQPNQLVATRRARSAQSARHRFMGAN
jgi:regulator of nucleoside diphosphate kinase